MKVYESMPVNKLEWKPEEGNGRSALDIMHECIVADKFSAATISSGAFPDLDWAGERSKAAAIPVGELVSQFKAGGEALIVVVKSLDENRLDILFEFPGSERKWTFAELLFLPGSHLDYHTGQINYIQTLYGDRERR